MIDLVVNESQIVKLYSKFDKYGPYALQQGLNAANDYLNSPDVRAGMYPPPGNGAPFAWSSAKQRRAYFATNGFGGGIPYSRTMQLYDNAKFVVNESTFFIEYINGVPHAQWVQSPAYQIIGHKKRGWLFVTKYISSNKAEVINRFKPAVLDAWEQLDSFISSGGAGL